MVLLEVSLMNFFLKGEGENVVTQSIIDELHSSDIERVQMERESGLTRSIMDELHFWNMERDQKEGESMVLLEVSSMNFTLGI